MGWQRGDGRVTGWRRLATSPGAPRCERNVSGATTTAARGGSETFRDVTPGPIEQQQQQEQGRRHEVRQREGNRKRARLGPLHGEIGAVVEKFEIAPKVRRKKLKFLGYKKIKHYRI